MRLFLSVVISRLSKASLPAPRITSKASLLPAPPTHRLLAPRKCPSTAVTRSRRILRAWSAATTAIPPTRKQTLQLTTRNTPDRGRFRSFRKDSRQNQCKNSIISFLSNLLQGRRSAAGSRHRPNTASWKLGNVLPEWCLLLCRSSEKNLAARRSTRTDSWAIQTKAFRTLRIFRRKNHRAFSQVNLTTTRFILIYKLERVKSRFS